MSAPYTTPEPLPAPPEPTPRDEPGRAISRAIIEAQLTVRDYGGRRCRVKNVGLIGRISEIEAALGVQYRSLSDRGRALFRRLLADLLHRHADQLAEREAARHRRENRWRLIAEERLHLSSDDVDAMYSGHRRDRERFATFVDAYAEAA